MMAENMTMTIRVFPEGPPTRSEAAVGNAFEIGMEIGRMAERDACLAIAESEVDYWRERGADGQFAAENIAHAIRKREGA